MSSFCAVFNCSYRTGMTDRKTSLITIFPQMSKIMANKALNFCEK